MDLNNIGYIVPNLSPYVVDREKFWKWWDEVTIPIKRITKDSRGNGGGFEGEFWDGVTVWQDPNYQQNIVWKVNYHPNEELFGEMIQRLHAELPWWSRSM